MNRANYIPAPHFFNLNMVCQIVAQAFGGSGGYGVYLVGSAMERRDYRDVDVRCILDDAEYDRLFPGLGGNPSLHPLWSLLCSSISLYLSQHSGLPVDFQIQKQSEAPTKHTGGTQRHVLGMFFDSKPEEPAK